MSDEIKSSSGSAGASMTPDRRCYQCGYALRGLPTTGRCPECGADYDPGSRRLEPWPPPLSVCLRIGWPLIGLAFCVGVLFSGRESVIIFFLGCAFLFGAPVNGYFQVRSMLRRHMPERPRTSGMVAFLRGLGTLVCVLAALLFLGPLIALGACLLSGGSMI